MNKKILDVGQCGIDGPRLQRLLNTKVGATVDNADTLDDAAAKLAETRYDLVLVNREFAADDSLGLDLIRRMKQAGDATPVMLVSDHSDAQEKARELGAIEGFGKAAMSDPATVALLKRAIGL